MTNNYLVKKKLNFKDNKSQLTIADLIIISQAFFSRNFKV